MMGRPQGPSPKGASQVATARNVRAFCRARFVERFGRKWEDRDAALVLGTDAETPDDELASQGRQAWQGMRTRDRASQRRSRAAAKEIALVSIDLRKAVRAATKAASRLRNAMNEAEETRARWTELLVPQSNEPDWSNVEGTGLAELAALLESLPTLRDETAGREVSLRRRVFAHAADLLNADGRRVKLEPRDLAVIGILAGVPLALRKGERVSGVLRRHALACGQMKKRSRS